MRWAGGSRGRTEWSLRDLPSPAGYAAAGAVAASWVPECEWRELSIKVPGGATLHKKIPALAVGSGSLG